MNSTFEKIFGKYDTLVFFDTETTGLDATKEQIIELAAVATRADGTRKEMDKFVTLHLRDTLPSEIVEKTHITDEMLASEGHPEEEVVREFMSLFGEKTLLVAYNVQFDLDFTVHAILRSARDQLKLFNTADYLDPMAVYKDRHQYPHRLENAIETYQVDAVNSHRAIDDVDALVKVTEAMEAERNDVFKYVNVFGYNPKYGLPERKFKKVCYYPQPFGKPKLPYEILPYKAGVIAYRKGDEDEKIV